MTARGRGEARATIIDIARLAGVSKSTVSLVLKNSPMVKDETRTRVEAAMGEVGYVYNRAAANLRMARSNFVGMIISDLMNTFFSELAAGIEEALYRAGYVPILANTNEDPVREARVLQSMREQGVAGIIISPTGLTDSDALAEFRHSRIPVVTVARRVHGAHLAYVGQDNVNGAYMATQYLIELGHKTIAFLGGASSAATQRERLQGYGQALIAAGLAADPALVFESMPTRAGGQDATQAMLASEVDATAAVCFNDVVAFGVIHTLADHGIETGRDFSVIGFDNIAESEFHRPPLTTITAHTRMMGEHGAQILLAMIEQPNLPIDVLIEPAQLIIRESCAPAPPHPPKPLAALEGVVPGMMKFHAGEDCSPEQLNRGYLHGFSIDFRDEVARDAYLVHPDHKAAGARLGQAGTPYIRVLHAGIDPDHARMCRIILPAIEAPDTVIRILRQSTLAENRTSRDHISINYSAAHEDSRSQFHQADCLFDTALSGTSADQIIGFSRDYIEFSDIKLFILKRFWLNTSAASVSDPEPVSGVSRVPVVSPSFAYFAQSVLNGLPLIAIYGLLAAAYSLIFGLIGRINLAFGEIAALGGYAALYGVIFAANSGPVGLIAAAIALALFATAIHGGVLSRLVFLPLSRTTGQQALVGTIGLAVFLQEYLRLTQGAHLRWIKPVSNEPVALLRSDHFITTLTPISMIVVALTLASSIGLIIYMQKSRFGRTWRAYSDDPLAAQLFGIDPRQLFGQTFGLACGLAGLAGATMTLFYGGVGYGASTSLGLKALIAALLGGIGSVPGAFLGGFIIGQTEALWSAYFPIVYRDLVTYGLLSIILILRPGGLFGLPLLKPRQI
eukprot:gene2519-2558_t